MNSKLRTEGEGLTDIEIPRSIPGVGTVVLATLIAEAWDLIRRRDVKALRCLGGVAPVAKGCMQEPLSRVSCSGRGSRKA